MIVILDANVLLRLADPTAPLKPMALSAITVLNAAGMMLRTLPQSIFEFWVVATRPRANNGLGLSVAECESELAKLLVTSPTLDDPQGLVSEWRTLVNIHGCMGKVAHDARYVAAMRLLGITHILTFNVGDFARYPGIIVLDPSSVAAAIAKP